MSLFLLLTNPEEFRENFWASDRATRAVADAANVRERIQEFLAPKTLRKIKNDYDAQQRWFKDIIVTREYLRLGQLVALDIYGSAATQRLEWIAREYALNEIDDTIIPTYTHAFGDIMPAEYDLSPRVNKKNYPYKFWKKSAA